MSETIIVETIKSEEPKPSISPDDKNIWILMIIGGIFFGFIPSLVVYLIKGENSLLKSVAKDNLNFQITFLIYCTAASMTMLVLIGFILLPIVLISGLIISILAAVAASNNQKYKYPLTIDY